MADISVLQIGSTDWTDQIDNSLIDWQYSSILDLPIRLAMQRDPYVLEQTYVVLTDDVLESSLLSGQISEWPALRTLYFATAISPEFQQVLDERRAFCIPDKTPQTVMARILTDFQFQQIGFSTRFSEAQFEPMTVKNIHFKREGRFSAKFSGDFGQKWQQIGQLNTMVHDFNSNVTHDVWLDYEQTGTADVRIQFIFFKDGIIQTIQTIEGDQLRQLTTVGDVEDYQSYRILVYARGAGELNLHVLHQRQSRHGFGSLIPGDTWQLTAENEEVLSYFNPGDGKGPLIVNFSGLRLHVDGFEMLGPLRDIGTPYLLFTDARMQGGAFDIGSESYESIVIKTIKRAMDTLHISSKDVILTGYSMGSFPALYYAADILPGAVVIAKPIVNIGSMTADEDFPREFNQDWTLDLRRYLAGRMNPEDTEDLNQILWQHIDKTDWERIPVSLFTMSEDDYDGKSLPQLISFLKQHNCPVTHHVEQGIHTAKIQEMVEFMISELIKYRDDMRRKG